MHSKEWVRPGYLSNIVRADDRRCEFDCKNQVIVQNEVPVDLLFIGDSNIQMWELTAYFHDSGLRMINRGIGGDRTAYLLHRFYADAIQLRPKYCVMMIGINDSWLMEDDALKQEKGLPVDVVLNEALENVQKILELAHEEQLPIAVCSLLPTQMYWTNHEKDRQDYIQRYNEGIKRLAEAFGQKYIDFYHAFVKEDGCSLNGELSTEGLHPNVFGYNKMSEILLNELKKDKTVSMSMQNRISAALTQW